jgi:hypothetical protein
MDGDVSHSSEIKLRTLRRDVLLLPSLSLHLSLLCYTLFLFYLDCSFHLPVGPHPPNG